MLNERFDNKMKDHHWIQSKLSLVYLNLFQVIHLQLSVQNSQNS